MPQQTISLKQRQWLERQIEQWQSAGVITGEQGGRILSDYDSAGAIRSRQTHRAFVALCALAVVMAVIGLILVVGFNWDQIPRPAKVAGIFALLIAAFACSALMYARSHTIIGELLALLGVGIYGSGIWLLAQTYHIESHYPDGMMWWMIGALLAALLLRSIIIGVAAIALMATWGGMEGFDFNHANYLFLLPNAACVWLAYRTRSATLLGLAIGAFVFWMLSYIVAYAPIEESGAAIMALAGGGIYALGSLHVKNTRFGRIAMILGALTFLVALLPMTYTDFLDEAIRHPYRYWRRSYSQETAVIVICVMSVFALVPLALQSVRQRKLTEHWPVLLAMIGCAAFALLAQTQILDDAALVPFRAEWATAGFAMLFNALVLVLGLFLIFRGVKLDRGLNFFAGVCYILLLTLLRWIDLVGDMLSSAMLFFIASAVLLITAIYWRKRALRAAAAAAAGAGEVSHA